MRTEDENNEKINAADSVDPNEAPEILDKEADDKPAAMNIRTTIIIAVVILAIIYAIYELSTK